MKNLGKNFMRYVSLNVMGMIGLSCYILADTFFIAQALGTLGLAALNFSIVIFTAMNGIGLMIGIGGSIDFSMRRITSEGAGNRSFVHSLVIGAGFAAVLVVIGAFFSRPLAALLGADAQTLPMTQTYLQTVLCFAPLFILNNIMVAFIRNDHNPKLAMIAMLVSSLSNVALDYIFMFPLGMGMFGAAFATGLSPLVSLAILSLHLRKPHGFRLAKCKIKARRILQILSFGFSSFIGEMASAIALFAFNLIILRIEGNVGVAAYGVIANVAIIVTAIFTGVAQGTQPLATQCYAEGNQADAKKVLRYCLTTSIALAFALYALIFLCTDQIVAFFNSEQNKTLATIAAQGVKIYFVGYFFAGINIVAAAFLSSIAKASQAMLISLLRSSIVLIPAVLGLSAWLGMTGVWLSFVVTEAIVCGFSGASLILFHRQTIA
ncbi:MAG: MATE family efflux transporter [Clostridiales bacterium]|nr:MATE family efflux transporter [Clostridiales bacterium]